MAFRTPQAMIGWADRWRLVTLPAMLHIALHVAVPVLVALMLYRRHWRLATLTLIATMLVDLDHLVADPIYDPERCSIGLHPLHTTLAIVCYAVLFSLPLMLRRKAAIPALRATGRTLHLIGLGLLIHMALDWTDCLL